MCELPPGHLLYNHNTEFLHKAFGQTHPSYEAARESLGFVAAEQHHNVCLTISEQKLFISKKM